MTCEGELELDIVRKMSGEQSRRGGTSSDTRVLETINDYGYKTMHSVLESTMFARGFPRWEGDMRPWGRVGITITARPLDALLVHRLYSQGGAITIHIDTLRY